MGKMKTYAQWRLSENMREFDFYYKKIKKLCMVMFKWNNLPSGISTRYLEQMLFQTGLVVFFKHDILGYVVCQATAVGVNNYDEPVGYKVISNDGMINQYVTLDKCVPIYNDIDRSGNVANATYFAKKISNVVKTIDINIDNMKQPYIVECSEGQRKTVEEVFKKRTNGEPLIVVNEDFARNVHMNVFDLHIPDYTATLTNLKNEIMNECLTFFGINNVNILKKERLNTGEVNQNNEQIQLSKDTFYDTRKKAVDEINKKFNLNIEVERASYDDINMKVGGLNE